MADREENPVRLAINNYVPQLKVRTHLRGGADYPDMSGVCNGTSSVPPTSGTTYPDMSGVCNSGTTPPTTGGGYVNGVYYPDKSGVCV
ncbi:MAG: hypothetical protein ACWGO1_02735 [Anaerolineales bacterium]